MTTKYRLASAEIRFLEIFCIKMIAYLLVAICSSAAGFQLHSGSRRLDVLQMSSVSPKRKVDIPAYLPIGRSY